jgi:hypothetical protein
MVRTIKISTDKRRTMFARSCRVPGRPRFRSSNPRDSKTHYQPEDRQCPGTHYSARSAHERHSSDRVMQNASVLRAPVRPRRQATRETHHVSLVPLHGEHATVLAAVTLKSAILDRHCARWPSARTGQDGWMVSIEQMDT